MSLFYYILSRKPHHVALLAENLVLVSGTIEINLQRKITEQELVEWCEFHFPCVVVIKQNHEQGNVSLLT